MTTRTEPRGPKLSPSSDLRCHSPRMPQAKRAPVPMLPGLDLPKSARSKIPVYPEEALFLLSPSAVVERLRRLDWAFEKDDTGFLAHDIHPYPAKFIPQIPGTLIAVLSARGELVLDPFGGSGTTALEAIRLGRSRAKHRF